MNKTYSVGLGLLLNTSDVEEPILESPNISFELAERIRGFETITEMLQYLLDEKPPELKCGREHYLESKELDENMSGLCLKLKIHGYDDRGERLQYLYSILSRKYAEKKDTFKIITQFLMDMSERPTGVTNLTISSAIYSPQPDEEDSIDEDSERRKALLMQILLERDAEEEGHTTELQYSSDSELSEWSDDEEESIEEKSNNDIPPIRKIRTSSSFGEFSDLMETKPDPEILRKEIELHWANERARAKTYLQKEIRQFDVVALRSQPVISSLLVLQARFGEFWEWKRYTKQKSELHVAFEEDIVREILWQFIITNSASSPLFSENWLINSNLMVATLSRSSFSALVSKYGRLFSKLQNLRKFEKDVVSIRKGCDENLPFGPSKVYRNYAAGLSEISNYITKFVSKIERELKRNQRSLDDKSEPACTTLLQLEKKTRPIMEIVDVLYEVHSKSIPSPDAGEAPEPWFASIRLISCLETHLLVQTKPSLYGVLLFLFSKCLYALLDEILTALKTLKWDENYSLFKRDAVVRLNDSNFWSDCIKVRPYQEQLVCLGISPLSCLNKFLPKVLNILKTCEVLDQLEEDFTRILGKSNIEVSDMISEFLEESLVPYSDSRCSEKVSHKSKSETENNIDFLKHFSYMGLGKSFVADSFRFLTSGEHSTSSVQQQRIMQYKLLDFINLSKIPIVAHTLTVDKILSKWFDPFCHSAKDNIQKIFQDYNIIESMTVFQEIILSVREDFARAVIEIASDNNRSEEYKYEDTLNRNPRFQKLLSECYPEGRESFNVDLKLDSSSDMNCTFLVTPHFPLNLIVTPQSVAGYLFIGRQLHRIRKSLWDVSSLHLKDCKPTEGVDVKRLLMFRFSLINFCSSIRSFFTLRLFSKDFSEFAKSASYEDDLDSIRRIHEDYLECIETRMLRNPVIENVIIRKIVVMSEALKKRWSTGIPQTTMRMLEDTLKKCWHVVNDFQSTKYSFDFNELSYHFGPPPTCL